MKIQPIDIVINYIGRRGDGVGEWQGRPVFVPRALPGETVRVRLREDRDRGIAGQLEEVLEPSPDRRRAPCPYYESCGGCALQHWDQTAYRNWKADRVRGLLDKAGLVPASWKDPVFIPAGTRRRTTLAAFLQNKNLRLGYHRARSHDIIDIPACMVLTPRLEEIRNKIRPHLLHILTDSRPADVFIQDTGSAVDVMITGPVGARKTPGLAEREAIAAMVHDAGLARVSWRMKDRDEPEIVVQAGPVTKQCGPVTVHLPPGAFMQPSAEGEEALVRTVMAAVPVGARTADLFAGCGTFTGPLSVQGQVHAVESDLAAVNTLKKSGLSADRRNLFSDPLTAMELKKFDAVILDPPRMGAAEQSLTLAKSEVPLTVSVSCNPSTFVRDARFLVESGYRLDSVQVIDQFVWSSHIELVGVFRK